MNVQIQRAAEALDQRDRTGAGLRPRQLQARLAASLEKKRLHDREQAFLAQIHHEREKSDRLLLSILPAPIAERLKAGEQDIADGFESVTVLFADLVEFTDFAARHPATEVVERLNEIFRAFDAVVARRGLEKIKTIGDAYMLAGGLPVPRSDHAEAVTSAAVEMLAVAARVRRARGAGFELRVGIHSGPVVAGVIGQSKFGYDLWGDTVNVASRMESSGVPGRIQVSQDTRGLLGDRFRFESRGPIAIKGRGEMHTYLLLGEA